MNMCVRNFQSNHCFTHLLAREGLFDGTGYLLCKYVHCSQVFIAQIENIVYFLFGHYQCMSLYQRVDIEKCEELVVFRHLVAGDFACDDSAEYLSLIHISEPTRQAEISYAVFCLKKKKKKTSA